MSSRRASLIHRSAGPYYGLRVIVSVSILLLILLAVCSTAAASDSAQDPASLPESINLPVGETRVLSAEGVTRIAVGDPSIADVVISGSELLVNGKGPGKTSLHLWFGTEVRSITIVAYKDQAELVAAAMQLIQSPGIRLIPTDTGVILEGTAASAEEKERALKVVSAYFTNVIDLVSSPDTSAQVDDGIKRSIESLVASLGVEVRVSNRRALLTGVVDRESVKAAAEAMADFYADEVINAIEVESKAEQQANDGAEASAVGAATSTASTPAPEQTEGSAVAGAPLPDIRRAETLEELLGEEGVEATLVGDKLVVEGTVQDQNGKDRVLRLSGAFCSNVVDVVDVSDPVQVVIRTVIAEVNRGLGEEIGIQWGMDSVDGMQPWTFVIPVPIPGANTVAGLPAIAARLKALLDSSDSRILASPSLLTVSGQQASFLAGGEIPIFLGKDGEKILVQWREYGIRLNVTPSVDRAGLVHLDIEPEVSDLDPDHALRVGDYAIPAFTARRVRTSVIVKDGQTLAIGGLLSTKDSKSVERFPVLGDLPIIGTLFRSERYTKGQSELVVLLTPEVYRVSKQEPAQ